MTQPSDALNLDASHDANRLTNSVTRPTLPEPESLDWSGVRGEAVYVVAGERVFGAHAQSVVRRRRRLQLHQHALSELKPALRALHHDFIALPEHVPDRHAAARALHKRRMAAKVVQHRAGIGLHEHARDRVVCIADVIEMYERVRAEAIKNLFAEHCHETAIGTDELQCP